MQGVLKFAITYLSHLLNTTGYRATLKNKTYTQSIHKQQSDENYVVK